VKRLKIHQLEATGTLDATTYLRGDGSWSAMSGSGLPWFNVVDYGAVGDNTADDTTAINAAIADLNTAGRGVLYFPAGHYKITATLTTVDAHCLILGDGAGDYQAQNAATTIQFDSTTATVFTLHEDGIIVRDIAFESSTALTHTAGSAIHVTQGDLNRYLNISVRGFYDCINIEDGTMWEMASCMIIDPVRYGLYLRHTDSVDGGDWVIYGGAIIAGVRNASAAIRWETGGGGRILGTKVNSYGTGHFTYGVDASIINADTTNMILSGLSIENVTGNCVRVTHSGTGGFGHVTLDAVQTAQYQSGSTPAIDISNVRLVSLDGLTMVASPSRSCEAIKLTSVTTARIGQRMASGYTSGDYTATTSTDVVDITSGVPSTRTITTGTGLTGGGDLSADRTLAIDTSAEAERIRDTIGTALIAGTNVTITVNDPSDTITIAAAATGGAGELLMQDGVSAPPVPIENEARTDWLYQG
jgi:hypothetical protein